MGRIKIFRSNQIFYRTGESGCAALWSSVGTAFGGRRAQYKNLLIFAKLYDIPHGDREARIRSALAFMGLVDAAQQVVRTYSGGMIRRLEIAEAMLHRPRVLFSTSQPSGWIRWHEPQCGSTLNNCAVIMARLSF
jgi:hypothetical protein